jgi:hypothetical protein
MADFGRWRGTISGMGGDAVELLHDGRRRPRTASAPPLLSLPGGHGGSSLQARARARWCGASGRVVGPRGSLSIPLDMKEAGGRRLFPGLLQATAAAHLPAKLTGIRMAGVFPDTGAGGLIAARSDPSPSSC